MHSKSKRGTEPRKTRIARLSIHLSEGKNGEKNGKLLTQLLSGFPKRDAPIDPYGGDRQCFSARQTFPFLFVPLFRSSNFSARISLLFSVLLSARHCFHGGLFRSIGNFRKLHVIFVCAACSHFSLLTARSSSRLKSTMQRTIGARSPSPSESPRKAAKRELGAHSSSESPRKAKREFLPQGPLLQARKGGVLSASWPEWLRRSSGDSSCEGHRAMG